MGVHETVKSSYLRVDDIISNNPFSDVKWFVEQEANTWSDWVQMPLSKRLALWRHGFTSPCGILYDFETHGYDSFLSEHQKNRLYRAANGEHRYLVDDKLSQHWMLSDYPENRPTAYGLLRDERIHSVADCTFDGASEPIDEWLPAKLQHESPLVLKHLRGKGGKEVLVAGFDESDGYQLDGRQLSKSGLCQAVRSVDDYLVTEFIDQHQYADDLYPDASNTIRLITVWDDLSEQLCIPAGIHRIGTDRSSPLDNFSAGGLSVGLDLETGTLGKAVQYPYDGSITWHTHHPDTGAQIEGVEIPQFREVVDLVERIARENTNIPILGWDILLDESGVPVILEANTGTSIDLMQVHQPLLEIADFRRVVSRFLPEVTHDIDDGTSG